ncbi:MAG: ATP-binding cassette domain-containing protein [Epsilonproteobacteria bacterium]|nr:ATP-binding cassette domain-containing protein [Campylobacterota bacterium]
MSYIIEFENIHVGYDEEVVLKEVTLKIKAKEHWAILGANGSGKSTLLKLIQSELHPRQEYKHKKEILGKARYALWDLKKELGIITSDLHNFFDVSGAYLSGYEVVLSGYYSTIGVFKHQDFSETQHQKASEVIAYLDISHLKEKKVSAMSTGELRKCIVARALIHDPKAFILDEPTTGLDIKAQINFIAMLQKLSQKATIILVTHHIEEIFPQISHVALIHEKSIYKQGLKEEVLNSENISDIFEMALKIDQENDRFYIKEIE